MWKRGETIKLGSCLIKACSEKPEICLKINHSIFTIFFLNPSFFLLAAKPKSLEGK